MIEDMYKTNGNTKVTLVVHSMGGLVSLHFLTGFSGINQAWKDKYIHAYVTLSAAWSGGAATVQSVVSGYHGISDLLLFAYGLISNFIVPIGRTFESIPWLFPKASVFGNDVLISTPSKQYTANDYEQLFFVTSMLRRSIGLFKVCKVYYQTTPLPMYQRTVSMELAYLPRKNSLIQKI